MPESRFTAAVKIIKERIKSYDWTYYDVPGTDGKEKMFRWPGSESEDIIITVGKDMQEPQLFHRHNYFYFNYLFRGQQEIISYKSDHKIILRRNDIYAGQPFAGHAQLPRGEENVLIAVLIRPEALFNYFLPSLSNTPRMLKFLLEPSENRHSEEIIHFNIRKDDHIRALLEMMVIEYAEDRPDTQDMLKPLVLAFLMNIARRYSRQEKTKTPRTVSARIVKYINEHLNTVSLKEVADHFSYHPNYLSSLMHKELGKTFSQILLELRMKRAVVLLKGTTLPVERISAMLGYSNPSNFHKAFREYYHLSPREYIARSKNISVPPEI